MPEAVVGGNTRYPSLQLICDLFRSQINDDMSGATNTPGEGQIATNTSPFLLSFLNSAIRDTFTDLRTVGDPSLILDNYLLLGIPALSVQNSTIQVALSYAGFFNGYTWSNQWALPIGLERVERLWERTSGSNGSFFPMEPARDGIFGRLQGDRMGCWELRQGMIWMPGAMQAVDLRIRCSISVPDFKNAATIDFTTAYVPIVGCVNAIVAKMLVLYAKRFAPDMYQMSAAEDTRMIEKLRLEIVRQAQGAQNQRTEFGWEATAGIYL